MNQVWIDQAILHIQLHRTPERSTSIKYQQVEFST